MNRIRPNEKCVVCGHKGWCLIAADKSAAICGRTPSDKRCGDAGWLHRLGESKPVWNDPPPRVEMRPIVDWPKLVSECIGSLPDYSLAQTLGVTVDSLRRLMLGWNRQLGCWTFPMSDSHGSPIGIRTRFPNGDKRSIPGSQSGLFFPIGLDVQMPLWICEGPTDTAALLTLGFDAVGRPNNIGGLDLLCELIKRWECQAVYIVPDRDREDTAGAEATRRGTHLLQEACRWHGKRSKVIRPPHAKDIRDWMRNGGTAQSLRYIAGAM